MAADGATLCSTRIGPQKSKKNGGEIYKYLTENRLERTQFWRKVGGVLEFDEVALEQELMRRAGQRPQLGTVVGHCSCGAACPSREKRGGDRMAGRERQRALRERSRDDHTLSRILARTLSPLQGGSVPRTAERPSKLQLLGRWERHPVKKGPCDLCWDHQPNQ